MDIVQAWMSTPAITATLDTLLPEARRLMRSHRIRRLPIVDSDGALIGIVTEGDINRVSDSSETDVREYNLYHRARDLPIREIMTRPVHSVGPDTAILTAAQIMLDERIGGIPVVDGRRVIGIITESDLFRLIVKRQQVEARQVGQS